MLPPASSARQIATPTARLRRGSGLALSARPQPTDRAMQSPNGASQRRPRRPRPACCSSLKQASTQPAGGGGSSSRRVLVESVSNSTSRLCSSRRVSAPSAARIRRASSHSTGFANRYPPRARRFTFAPHSCARTTLSFSSWRSRLSSRINRRQQRGRPSPSSRSSSRVFKPPATEIAISGARDARCRRTCAPCCRGVYRARAAR